MQIDAIQYKPLTAQEKKRCFDGGLCLYCGESGHKADKCPKKQHCHTFKMRSATKSSNLQMEMEKPSHNRDCVARLFI
jgi:hypothetical protein